LEEKVWKIGAKLKKDFPKSLTGFLTKKAFLSRVLELPEGEVQDLVALKEKYDIAYNSASTTYTELTSVNPTDLAYHNLLNEPITSSSDSQFAQFINSIKAIDWVREGHEHFSNTESKGTCPYCQQALPIDFQTEIEKVFDAQYDKSIRILNDYRATYRSNGLAIWQTLKNNKENALSKISFEAYDDKVETYVSLMQLNIAEIDKKIKEPSIVVSLENTETILSEINNLISDFNRLVKTNNDIVNNQKANQKQCTEDIWKHIAFVTGDDVKAYKAEKKILDDEIAALTMTCIAAKAESFKLAGNIRDLSKTVVTTQKAIDNINQLLKESGFEGFNIQENTSVPNTYCVVRDNGELVTRLSEGERNFIAFMYFYQLVKGSMRNDGTNIGKIVVIDDPVSSMDSTALFIVSSLIREMVDITLNNYDLEYGSNAIQGFYIKQMFVLTHNHNT
jgi:wobble nucleotide-excising tRNase